MTTPAYFRSVALVEGGGCSFAVMSVAVDLMTDKSQVLSVRPCPNASSWLVITDVPMDPRPDAFVWNLVCEEHVSGCRDMWHAKGARTHLRPLLANTVWNRLRVWFGWRP